MYVGIKRAAAKIVPKLLNFRQNKNIFAWIMLTTFNDDPDLLKDRKKHVKFGQMWWFCSLFSSTAMVWCIMNSCHKIVRSIRNTTLKLCAYWAEAIPQKRTELWKNQSWILHHDNAPAHTTMLVHEILAKNKTVLLTVFFDCNCVVHNEFLPQGRTANKKYYLVVISWLREAIRQKHTELWKNQSWNLQHDNAIAYT